MRVRLGSHDEKCRLYQAVNLLWKCRETMILEERVRTPSSHRRRQAHGRSCLRKHIERYIFYESYAIKANFTPAEITERVSYFEIYFTFTARILLWKKKRAARWGNNEGRRIYSMIHYWFARKPPSFGTYAANSTYIITRYWMSRY